MVEVWKAKIKAEIPGHVWPSTDLDLRNHLFNSRVNDKGLRLSNYYYFFLNPARDLITAHQNKIKEIKVHPGLNRFIGSSFKDQSIWLDAIIYIDSPKICNPNVAWIDLVDKIKSKNAFDEAEKNDKNIVEKNEFVKILINDSQNARIEIVDEFGKSIVFNKTGIWNLTEHIADHGGVHATIKHIFQRVLQLKIQAET